MSEPRKRKCPAVGWMKRFGVAGFLFFLIKGIVVWILLPALLGYFGYTTMQ
jgi:hypothetical protein